MLLGALAVGLLASVATSPPQVFDEAEVEFADVAVGEEVLQRFTLNAAVDDSLDARLYGRCCVPEGAGPVTLQVEFLDVDEDAASGGERQLVNRETVGLEGPQRCVGESLPLTCATEGCARELVVRCVNESSVEHDAAPVDLTLYVDGRVRYNAPLFSCGPEKQRVFTITAHEGGGERHPFR